MQSYLGPLIAAIGILVSIQLYRLQKHKHLDWQLESRERLLANSEILRQRFELSYNGRVVKDPHVVTVWIGNRGRQRIKSEDYDTPLRIAVEGDTHGFRFLGAEIVSRGKGDPHTKLKDDSSGTTLSTDPLNQSDWLRIRLLTDGEPKDIKLTGHITNVRHFREVRGRGDVKVLTGTYNFIERADLVVAILQRAMLFLLAGLFAYAGILGYQEEKEISAIVAGLGRATFFAMLGVRAIARVLRDRGVR
jgi:hypothetical protein